MRVPRRPRTILFLIADTGAGHRSAANALVAALPLLSSSEPHNPRVPGWNAVIVDAFADGSRFPLRTGVSLYGPAIQHSPRIYGHVYRFTNTRTRFETARRLCQPFLRQGLRRLLERTRPDVIVSIHPLLNHITLLALHDLRLHIPLVTIVTDLVTVHCAWMAPGVDACVVPTHAVRAQALAAGIHQRHIHTLGMPVHPRFSIPDHRPRTEQRRALGLEANVPVVLMMSGGEGAAGLSDAVEALAAADLPAQLVVIAGRNAPLRAALERMRSRFSTPIHVFGFVENMPEFLHAADVVVTKAGPGAISEAMVCELPLVVMGAVPGQEEGNIDFVRDNGIGDVVETKAELVGTLRELLEFGSPRLEAHRLAMRRLRQPQASLDIARLIVSFLPGPATPSIWEVRRVRRHMTYRYFSRAGRAVSRHSLPRLAHVSTRSIDGMRRALPLPMQRHAGPGLNSMAGLARRAGIRALLKRELRETIQLRRSGSGRGRDDARSPVGGGRGAARVR